ncbi:hypothetical protein ACT3S7_06170 [Corynebacterium sp. AOP34-AQ2-28]|uniref:hypothetical protein n=1 Tax=Corynebacterium sp. AOP34-AQ2-28 TaxID=3457689 RepID=UPI00403364E8
MSNITRAAGIIRHMVKIENPTHDQDIAQELADAGLLAPDPQIIRTPAELEALDPDTLVLDAAGYTVRYGSQVGRWDLPAVVVASGEHVRACREALEGETT